MRAARAGAARKRRAERREHVLDAADRAFARHGYHEVSVDELAEGAGISKPGLYAYFGSKEGLYVEALRRAGERLGERIAAAAHGAETPEARMWAGIVATLGFVEEHRDAWRMLDSEPAGGTGPFAGEVRRSRRHLTELISGLFEETLAGVGVGRGPMDAVEPMVSAFVGAVEGMSRWWLDHPEVAKGTVAMYVMNVAWQGFGDLVEGRLWLPEGRS